MHHLLGHSIERPEVCENGNRVARPTRSRYVPGIYPRPSFGLHSAFSARLRTSSRPIAVTEHLPILSISSGRVLPSGAPFVYRIGAIACRVGSETTGDGSSRLFGRLRVDFGAVDVVGRGYCARSSRSRCAIIRTFFTSREYLFNNRESDGRLPHLRIDQVRGVRLGNPTGSDPR